MARTCAHPALSLHYLDLVNCTIAVRPVTLSSDPHLEVRWLRRRWRACRHRLLIPLGLGTTPKCYPGGPLRTREEPRTLSGRRHKARPPLPDTWGSQSPWRLVERAVSIRPTAEYDSGGQCGFRVGRAAPFEGGGAPHPPVAPVHPGVPDNLMEALRGASVMDEHHVLMGAVIAKI